MYNLDIIPRSYLCNNETLQRHLKQVRLIAYQLRQRDDVPAWSGTFKLATKKGQFILRHLTWFSLF